LPRAGVDRIDDAVAALAVIRLAVRRPPVHETIVLVLDSDRRGRSIVVVDGTEEPDAVLDVVETLAESIAASGESGALVVASVRPCGHPLDEDEDRWLEASDLAEALGVELVEWFVLNSTGTAWSPRDLICEPPRW
jgi:hypothetical protein